MAAKVWGFQCAHRCWCMQSHTMVAQTPLQSLHWKLTRGEKIPDCIRELIPSHFCAQLCFLIRCFTSWAVPTLSQSSDLDCVDLNGAKTKSGAEVSSVQSKMVSVSLKKPKHALHPAFQKFQCCIWNRLSICLVDSGLFSSSSEVLSEVRLVINACFVF